MMNRKGIYRLIQLIVFLILCTGPLAALDVVYLKNGDVILGSLVGPQDGGLLYKCFGEEKVITVELIDNTEKNLEALSKITVNVILKDDSAIRGKIVDFDEDIGVFLDISFGTLTIPTGAIKRIYDKEKSSKYGGAYYQISGLGGVYFPLGSSAEFFGPSWCAGADFEWGMAQIRGLYAGVKLTMYGMDYLPDDAIGYFMVSLRPEATYKYMGWRMDKGFLSSILPYASVGSGLVYIAINDPSSYPASFGNMTADVAASLGVEWTVTKGIVIDLCGTGSLVFQNGDPFTDVGVFLSISYEQ